MVRAKMILHEVWLRKTEWDQLLPDDLRDRWWSWFHELQNVTKLQIPRNYSKMFLSPDDLQLHLFSDASERAFSAVAYARVERRGEIETQLIASKTKIASLKINKIASMPRLELQGAVLSIRLANLIVKEHSVKFDKVVFWIDSKTVLSWIHSKNGVFKPFVAHRVAEIVESSYSSQWRYVPTQ